MELGLKNVKNVADHYLGDMDIKIKNDNVLLSRNKDHQRYYITKWNFRKTKFYFIKGKVEFRNTFNYQMDHVGDS